jgi:hypothetical protein
MSLGVIVHMSNPRTEIKHGAEQFLRLPDSFQGRELIQYVFLSLYRLLSPGLGNIAKNIDQVR